MLGQKESPYLVHEKHEDQGNCRFCHEKTRDIVYPPEIIDGIKNPHVPVFHSPIFVCTACRQVNWKVEKLRSLFNREVVESFIHRDEIPVIPQELQLDVTSLSPRLKTTGESRVFVYFFKNATRFLTEKYNEQLGSYQDVTKDHSELVLRIPELENTVLEIEFIEGTPKEVVIVYDCWKFRGLKLLDADREIRIRALLRVKEFFWLGSGWGFNLSETAK